MPSHVLSGLYYDKKRSLATGLATSGSGMGAIIFPLLVNFLVESYGWRGSFFIICGISMQNFVFASLLRPVPESLKKKYEKAAEEREIEIENSESNDLGRIELETKESDKLTRSRSRSSSSAKSVVLVSYSRKLSVEDETKTTEKIVMKTPAPTNSDDTIKVEDVNLQEKPDETDIGSHDHSDHSIGQTDAMIPGSPEQLLKRKTTDKSDSDLCNVSGTPRNSLNALEELALTKKSTCSVLCEYTFIIFFINNILWNMGVVIVLLFVPQYFTSVALDEQTSATVFSIGGFGAFFGSIIGGILGNFPKLRLDAVYIVITVLTGCVCLLFPVSAFHSFGGLTFLYVVFSVLCNIIAGLLVVAVASIVGPKAIGTGMGYAMLANGIGSVAAPPLIGNLILVLRSGIIK